MPFNQSSYGPVSILDSATLVIASNPARRGWNIYNYGTQTIFIGMDINVSTTTGIPILPRGSSSDSGDYNNYRGDIYCISATPGQDARYWEWTA